MKGTFDSIILGAGLYGLYAALFCARLGRRVLVLERDCAPFMRATYINQARIHQGYHYPRSLSTAMKSAYYFERFNRDFDFCIHREFEKVYATSTKYSWSDREQFISFCKAANIPCRELHPGQFFRPDMCDGAFLTREYTYDAKILRDYFVEELGKMSNVEICYNADVCAIHLDGENYAVNFRLPNDAESLAVAPFLLNATYASTNQVQDMLGFEGFKIKYELCEIILCNVNEQLKRYGITVMDGPFFSIMPFGKTPYHSLTSVTFTPHVTCHGENLPRFSCQERSGGYCSRDKLGNCNECAARPKTAFPYMANLARKYLRDKFSFEYVDSLFSMKPILVASEIDDSRPTVIRVQSKKPTFVSVLSGKINTVYDLDEVLSNG